MFKTRKYRIITIIAVLASIPLFMLLRDILTAPVEYYEVNLDIQGEGTVLPGTSLLLHPGTTAYLTAEPAANTNLGFSEWQGDITGSEDTVALKMTQDYEATAVFSEVPAPGHEFRSLTIAVSQPELGTTEPAPGTYRHIRGKQLIVKAFPGERGYFAGWVVTYPEHDASPPTELSTPIWPSYALCVDQDIVLVARFHSEGHTLTVEATGPGLITPEPGAYALADGLKLELTALPDRGCRLHHWENGTGTIVHVPKDELDNGLSVVLETNETYRAVFEKAEHKLLVHTLLDGAARGRIEPEINGRDAARIFPYGHTATLSAIPENGDTAFAGWSGTLPEDFSNTQCLSPELHLAMDEDRQVTGRFIEAETQLTLDAVTDGVPDARADALLSPAPGKYGFVRDTAAGIALNVAMVSGSPLAFDRWEGDLPEGFHALATRLYLPMNVDRHITAKFMETGTLPITVSGTGEGGGITTPTYGRYAVIPGRRLTLEAIPEQASVFGGWRVRSEDLPDVFYIENPLPLTIAQETEVNVRFGRDKCLFWVDASDGKAETRPSRGEYWLARGTEVTLEAKSIPDKNFHRWESSTGEKISESPRTNITLTGDAGYIAIFGPPLHKLSITSAGTGTGGIETDTEDPEHIPEGRSVRLIAHAGSDAVFSHWEGALPPNTNPQSDEIVIVMDMDKSVTACFDKADFQLTITVTGLAASDKAFIQPTPGTRGYRAGTEVVLTAFPPPDGNTRFSGWSGDVIGANPEYRLTMDRNRKVIAAFDPPEADSTATLILLPPNDSGENRLLPVELGSYSFRKGATLHISLTLAQDTFFAGWQHDYSDTIQYTDLPVIMDHDKTLEPALSDRGRTLTVMLDGKEGGSVDPPPGIYRLADGIEAPLTAQCTGKDYVFDGWYTPDGKRLSYHKRYTIGISLTIQRTEVIAVFRKYQTPPEMVLCRALSQR